MMTMGKINDLLYLFSFSFQEKIFHCKTPEWQFLEQFTTNNNHFSIDYKRFSVYKLATIWAKAAIIIMKLDRILRILERTPRFAFYLLHHWNKKQCLSCWPFFWHRTANLSPVAGSRMVFLTLQDINISCKRCLEIPNLH